MRSILATLTCMLLLCGIAFAQSDRGTITGTVADPAGALVPEATIEAKNAEIESLNSLILTDIELIALRKRITSSAESQYENGTITATELLNEINSEKQALVNYEIHKINLALAKVEYLNICGKEIE